MAMPFTWLRATWQSITAAPGESAGRRPLSVGIGYCPGCEHLRATTSLSCSYCGSTAAVPADA
jgi:hypothetical protein